MSNIEFDAIEAKKAVSRVKERSTGPDTLVELATILDAATRTILHLEGELVGLRAIAHTIKEQADNRIALADARSAEGQTTIAQLRARIGELEQVLAHIASMSWWEAMRHAAKIAHG